MKIACLAINCVGLIICGVLCSYSPSTATVIGLSMSCIGFGMGISNLMHDVAMGTFR